MIRSKPRAKVFKSDWTVLDLSKKLDQTGLDKHHFKPDRRFKKSMVRSDLRFFGVLQTPN